MDLAAAYSRTTSSSRYRSVLPELILEVPSSRTQLSTSWQRRSNTAPRSTTRYPHTPSAACSVHPPANTERRLQQRSLRLLEQVIARVQRCLKALLPRHGAVSTRQQRDRVSQARGDLLKRQHAHPNGGQLDGEGDPVEPAADGGGSRQAAGLLEREPGLASRARKSWTASEQASPEIPGSAPPEAAGLRSDSESGGTRHSASPESPRGRRLVARIRSSGHARSSRGLPRAASSRCSQLSSTSSRFRVLR